MKQLVNYFCTAIFSCCFLIKAHAQNQTFDNLNANDGIEKFLTWNTVINGSNYGFRWGNRTGTTGGNRGLLDIAARHDNGAYTTLMTFATNGTIGIRTTAPTPGYALDINGKTYINDQLGIGAMPSSSYKLRVNGKALYDDMVIARSLLVEGTGLGSESSEGSIYFHHGMVNMHRLRYSANTLYFERYTNLGYGSSGKPNFTVEGRILLPLASTSSNERTGIGLLGSSSEFQYDNEYLNNYGFGFHSYQESPSTNGSNAYIAATYGIDFFTATQHRVRINNNGNVGIKTNDPKYSLQIGNGTSTESLTLAGSEHSSNSSFISFQEGTTHKYMRLHYNAASNILRITSELGDIISFDRVTQNVGIGNITTLNPNNYRLAVNGKIGAKEIIVENTSATWPDYVFEKDYPLASLEEVEHFVQSNKHLPEVPSAMEVKEAGLNIGDMNAILLKKIEELTLYLIEQNKKINLLQEEITELKKH